jgi:hypothetical protein
MPFKFPSADCSNCGSHIKSIDTAFCIGREGDTCFWHCEKCWGPKQCYHCEKQITKRDDLFDAFSGEYFSNVKGKWLCLKCYEIQDAASSSLRG